jgi:hygromycin-B 7''-O-kinase
MRDDLAPFVPQGGSDFPPDWERIMSDPARWKRSVEAVCAEHGLPVEGRIQPGVAGSHAVFLTRDLVVKIYAAPWTIWFRREVESLQLLAQFPAAKTPRLLAFGDAAGGDPQHPYLVMERLPGASLDRVWDDLTERERISLAEQVGQMVRVLHAAPIAGLTAFVTDPEDWVRIIQARAKSCTAYLSEEERLPAHLLPQVEGWLEKNLPFLTPDFKPCLLSADLHADHILVRRVKGRWQVTGHIDLGDAEVGPSDYEWEALCLSAFRGGSSCVRALLEAWGGPSPLVGAARRRLKLYTLLHRFAEPAYPAQAAGKPTDVPDLETFLDSLWTS